MKYYPVNLNVVNQQCLVVGAGSVGTRKVNSLLQCGAVITVVSLEATEQICRLSKKDNITLHLRPYRSSDIENVFLVFGATNNESLNKKIFEDASRLGKLCNISDRPELCNFILPSVIRQGDLIIAISTSGRSPAYSRHLRMQLEPQFGPEYAFFLSLMGGVRKKLLEQKHDPEAHKPLFEQLIAEGLLERIRNCDKNMVNELLTSVLGQRYTLDSLMDEEMAKLYGEIEWKK